MTDTPDIAANRRARKWSRRALVGRVLWTLAQPLFRFSPRPFWGWRTLLLRSFGATIGHDVRVHPTARITIPWHLTIGDQTAIGDHAILYALGPIHIGARVTVSQNAHLCAGTHDFEGADMALIKSEITIGDDVWLCADSFVGPGVTVADGAVLGARGVAVRDLPAWIIAGGNPATPIRERKRRAA